jgi:hypothetical protein
MKRTLGKRLRDWYWWLWVRWPRQYRDYGIATMSGVDEEELNLSDKPTEYPAHQLKKSIPQMKEEEL